MTGKILDLFFQLSAIPRPSGGEGAAAEFLAGQLRRAGLCPELDASHNLRCPIPASPGCEGAPGVILQAHIDMVCAAAPHSGWRPGLDAVKPVLEGGFLRSDARSSLGADNGIGVALMLWLAQARPVPRPPVLLLFTASEEQGLLGAKALDRRWLEGWRWYLNLDAFRGDAAIVASAGGLRQCWSHPLRRRETALPACVSLTLSGLTGGHSGFDIHRGRANALAALGGFLAGCPGSLVDFSGGGDYNAIPAWAGARIATDRPGALRQAVEGWSRALRQTHLDTDPGLRVTLEPCPPARTVWTEETRRAALGFLARLPQGVLTWRRDCPDTPASSGNPAALDERETTLYLRHFARCADRAGLASLQAETEKAAEQYSFTLVERSAYAPWEGSPDTPLARRARALYRRQTGQPMEALALHVGLESSLILEKAPHLTGLGLGCDILDAHAVSERVRLASIPRLAALVTGLLAELSEEEPTQ